MFELTTNPVPVTASRGRNKRTVLTNRDCEARNVREGERKKYDSKCAGLYVSRNATGPNTFSLQVRDRFTGKTRSLKLGAFDRETFTIDHARAAYYAVMARIGAGENVFEVVRQHKTVKAKQGMTVNELIEKRIDWMSTLVRKADGEMRPRIESWESVASHLYRFISPNFGDRLAIEVTRGEIAALSNDIVDGKLGKSSVSSARHMRRAVSGLYRWAAEAGREYVPIECQPWANLPKLPDEHPRDRVLTPEEICVFWTGLDRPDIPWGRSTCLALKLELLTMLRSKELLAAHTRELFFLDKPGKAVFGVPLKRVKKRRVILQPLSDLAVEVIREALGDRKEGFVFAGRFDDAPLSRKVMAEALRGSKYKNGSVKTPGICSILGLEPFTPHDLRRTAATLAGELGHDDGLIAKCLDHQTARDKEGHRIPTVTGKHYALSRRTRQKRKVLDSIADAVRKILAGTFELEMDAEEEELLLLEAA